MFAEDLKQQINFLCEIDSLKNILRKSFLLNKSRNENSAEHSWHAAVAALVLSEYSNAEINISKVIKMLLLHDIVEIYAGDTFLYDEQNRQLQVEKEIKAAKEIFNLLPSAQSTIFQDIWREFEQAETNDAKFAKSVDRLMPVLHNYYTEGFGWKKHKIDKNKIIEKNKVIANGSEKLWKHVESLINKAEQKGYLECSNLYSGDLPDCRLYDLVLDVPLTTTSELQLNFGGFKTNINGKIEEHALIYKGNITNPENPILLRINSACYTGDIFHCSRCDCKWQLQNAMELIAKDGGLIIYHFEHEGRGIGFVDKLKTFTIMDQHDKTTKESFEIIGKQPDERDFLPSVLILKKLGINDVKLISNNPVKKDYLVNHGINVVGMVPSIVNDKSLEKYLNSKKEQFGHIL